MTTVAALARGSAILATVLAAAACASPPHEETTTAAHDRQLSPSTARAADMRPEQLLGLNADQLSGLLGPSDFTRNDGPAEIWQFRNNECVLDVFLYRDPAQGGYVVEHVEARDRGLVREADQACVANLLRVRRTRAAASSG